LGLPSRIFEKKIREGEKGDEITRFDGSGQESEKEERVAGRVRKRIAVVRRVRKRRAVAIRVRKRRAVARRARIKR
jgi:hypothetical protein